MTKKGAARDNVQSRLSPAHTGRCMDSIGWKPIGTPEDIEYSHRRARWSYPEDATMNVNRRRG
jgi:hypothetical protein